jgi:hypothetical protein
MPSEADPAVAHTIAEPPTGPWVVMDAKSPGDRLWIVVAAIPGIIPVSRTVHYPAIVNIRTIIARCIAYINHGWRIIIYIHIPDVVHWGAWRNLLNLWGNLHTYFPWPCGLC